MSKQSRGALLAMINLDAESNVPKFRQLGSQIRQAILKEELVPGSRLPSTRELARELSISRLTVQNTYEQLISEGYLEASVGSGSFVKPIRSNDQQPRRPSNNQEQGVIQNNCTLSRRSQRLSASPKIDHQVPRAFDGSIPALDRFPIKVWNKIYSRHCRRAQRELLCYGDSAGYYPLRQSIADYLRDARGVHCSPEQVLVVSGAQQAFCLSTWALLDPGEPAWVEDPGHISGRDALFGAGAKLVPVPVDEEGISIQEGVRRETSPKLIMVTPSHQHPLGTTTSLSRRLDLLDFANKAGSWLIEDDYDSEFRFVGRPLAAMQGIDPYQQVIYVGTFSKVLFPSLRLAYVVVPKALINTFTAVNGVLDRAAPTLPQAVLSDFIDEGHFTQHIRRMRNLYAERQQSLLEVLAAELGDLLRPEATDSGMHLMAWLPECLDDKKVSAAAAQKGVDVQPLSIYCVKESRPPGLLLGFSCIGQDDMTSAARILAVVIREQLAALSG
ncbi:PLP-dependent aminotransferase family protein [Motiliproteus sp. MSK22-1]|uniref:MocR-like pyridoxine biosynthesis transcription factor PdxR n=1 Tax=Motiliproteus sp. MSK22-1 TaxID=1897630 RepID=UPI00097564E8|nr:PLP-dependent aminotransferase family protein [Motiliproteus sp. MSK22-1]OMH38924.1 hypothetical protein BGP75_00700 [Motiliproteus sp. MSK22-1]